MAESNASLSTNAETGAVEKAAGCACGWSLPADRVKELVTYRAQEGVETNTHAVTEEQAALHDSQCSEPGTPDVLL